MLCSLLSADVKVLKNQGSFWKKGEAGVVQLLKRWKSNLEIQCRIAADNNNNNNNNNNNDNNKIINNNINYDNIITIIIIIYKNLYQ